MSNDYNERDTPSPLPEQPKSPLHSPHPPSIVNETHVPTPPLLAAKERASRKSVALTTILTTSFIFSSILAMIAILLSYLCAVHQCQLSSRSVISTAALGKVLTITEITSHLPPISIPIVMGLFSYLLSAKWLGSSSDGGPNRPTPMQLGLLMSICNGASFGSLFSSVKYVFERRTEKAKSKSISLAPILGQSIFTLASLLVIAYIATGADAWLHASSTSVLILSNSPYSTSAISNFGREINATLCQMASVFNNTGVTGQIVASSCGLINPGSGGSGVTLAEGIRVVSNTSNLHRVVFADDQTALLVPQSLPLNITYLAQTVGVRTRCTTITKDCVFTDGPLGYGPQVQLNLNCLKAGIKYGNVTGPLCALDGQGLCTEGTQISSNPFTTGEIATSIAYLSPDQVFDTFIGNTGWFVHGNSAWNVVFCNVTALEVAYTYTSSRFIIQSAIPKSVDETQHMMAAGFISPTTVVSNAVDGAGLQTNATYEQTYAIELSRQMLARGAFLYEPTSVTRIQSEINISGSNLRLAPLALFVVALILFACEILWIALKISITAWNVKYVGLAALHLTDPMAMVQSLYGHTDPLLTWETDTTKRFGVETDLDRLHVGPVRSDDSEVSSVFLVTKG